MLVILQAILAFILTALYAVNINLVFDFSGIITVFLVFIVFNIIVALVLLLLFVIFIYTTEKMSMKAMWKHYVVHYYSMYLFRFYYRVRLIVTGKENIPKNNNFVVYCNHIEYTDPLFIMQVYKNFPIAFVAKKPLFRFPILKNLMYSLGNIPITRYSDRSALESIIKAIGQVKNGQPMGVFPEGKRTYKNELIEFKPGSFKLAQKAKADISPICIYDMHKLAKKWRILPTKVYMHILPLITYEEYKDLDTVSLSQKVYDIINEQLNKYKNN